jgi:predicted DNA-binding transcriptional regulator AlpA
MTTIMRTPLLAQQPLLTQHQVSKQLGLSERTLERLRVSGDGPPFAKLGKRVFYRQSDLDDWIASRLCQSTSERRAQ